MKRGGTFGLQEWAAGGSTHVFCVCCRSLVIMENADPSARRYPERFMERLVPEHDPVYPILKDRQPCLAHKMALTRTTEVIPFVTGNYAWEPGNAFLWEHRSQSQKRRIVLSYRG